MPPLFRRPLAACLFGTAAVFSLSAQAQRDPEEGIKALKTPEGMEISLFASEPMITNPSAVDVDSHGRVWVAEIQWYRGAAKDPPADKIKVLEDTDGDGLADKMTVFADGLFCPMSVTVAGDKVYVATSPDLWMFEDKNGDLKADGPPTKVLTGFGGRNHDHGAHSIVLGPDHKWWMAHGDTGLNVTGVDGSKIASRWGAMIRGELDGSKLEVVASNFRNPYEICVNSFGESFCSDNDNDGNQSVRICWILEGGDYGWFGGPPFTFNQLNEKLAPGVPYREHFHFRGHIPGNVPGMLITGFGSPCGICYYEGDAFGPKYKNLPFHCDAGPREVRVYPHKNHGYGMTAASENVVTSAGDNYFRPDDVCAAPDGSLYIADWYDGGVGGHAYNDPNRGRIYLLRPGDKKLSPVAKPGPYTNTADAVAALASPNLATQFLARERLLADGPSGVPALEKLLTSPDPNLQARALWLLDRIGGSARSNVAARLNHKDPAFRALAVRILRRHGAEFAPQLLAMADDPSPEVRREVLLAAGKIDAPADLKATAQQVIVKLARTYDGADRFQLEAINIAAGSQKAELFQQLALAGASSAARLDLMQVLDPKAAAEFLAQQLQTTGVDEATRRTLLDAAGSVADPQAAAGVVKMVGDPRNSASLRRLALQKLNANLSGPWREAASGDALAGALKTSLGEADLRPAVLELVGAHGLASLGPDVLALAQNGSLPADVRRKAVEVAVQLKPNGLGAALSTLMKDGQVEVSDAALSGLIDLQETKTLVPLLTQAPVDGLAGRTADRMMATTGGALALFRVLDSGALPAGLKDRVLASAGGHPDAHVRALFEKHLPPGQRAQKLGDALKPEQILSLTGDPARGRQIFQHSTAAQCKNCHMVQGVGGALGPDLSQIGKKFERGALLDTILLPSKAVAPEYYTYLLETDGGQIFAGFLVEKTDQQVVLKDSQNKLIRVPAGEVVALVKQDKSMMPELVLKDVSAQDAADLLAYLQTLTVGTVPVTRFRVLGPLASGGSPLDHVFPVEKEAASPNLSAEHAGVDGKPVRWDLTSAEDVGGFFAVDSVRFAGAKKMRGEHVVHYFLTYIDSPEALDAELLLGSDDGCKVWLNGAEVHRNPASRAMGYAQDKVAVKLKTGRNVVLVKVFNGAGPGGATLAVSSSGVLQLRTE